jgi:hypothetical protein
MAFLVLLAITLVSYAHSEYVSSDKWASYEDGGYTIRNDVWGTGAGTSTLHVTTYKNWYVHADHPVTCSGCVKAYTHVAKAVNKKISALGTCTSTFTVSVPSSGDYSADYDIWLDNNKYEVLLWMTERGAVGPLGSSAANATVGGHTWNVHKGSNGSNYVFSFVISSSTSSATVDVKAILQWIEKQGWTADATLGEVQFGFEITSSAGGLDFKVTNFGVSC